MPPRRTRRITHDERDWDKTGDKEERRRLQNRKNQQNFRARKRKERATQSTETAAACPETPTIGEGNITVVPQASNDHQGCSLPPGYDNHLVEESQPVPPSPFAIFQSPTGMFALGEHYYNPIDSNPTPIATLDPNTRK